MQWQRSRVKGRSWGWALKVPVTRLQKQEKWMVWVVGVGGDEDMVEVGWEGVGWFDFCFGCLLFTYLY